MQIQSSFAELLPADQLQIRIQSNEWNKRRQIYEQILYLLKEQQNDDHQISNNNSSDFTDEHNKNKKMFKTLNICGKEYTVKRLIPYFQDIVDQEHPGVLLPALSCVEVMTDKGMCSGRQFVKLIDQGFDKFPLKINKGKQIMQKFADIIEKIQLQPQFLLKKISNSAHQKCMIFALQVISMLGMTQLYGKVKQISQKHAKSSVRQVASQIWKQLEQLKGESQEQDPKEEQKKAKLPNRNQNQIQNIQTQNLGKPGKFHHRSKTPTKNTSAQENYNFTRTQLDILEKVPQYEQLESKNQQKFSENLTQLLQRHFKMLREGKQVPQLPMNQLSNLSYIIRIMIESNNAITSTNGLKLLHLLSTENSQLLPRSFPLLFIFQKFRLHATHSINQLLYQLCDSLLLINAISTNRNVDLIQAVSQGAGNKKGNVRYGCFMVFVRTVAILYNKWEIFQENEGDIPQQITNKINQGDCEKIKQKLYKLLVKSFQNFSAKMSDDKKNEQKLQDIKITMSLAYGSGVSTAQSAVSSLQNLKNKTLKKNLSQASQKVQTNLKSTKAPTQQISQKPRPSTTRSQTQLPYKIINPQQKSSKILQLCQNVTPAALASIKKLISQSLLQFQQCVEQQRFQLFYYSQVLQNFMNLYEPDDKTCDLISQYLIQLLIRISKMKHNQKIDANFKILKEGLTNMIRICLCNIVIGNERLVQVFDNLISNSGPSVFVQALVRLDESKKNHKIKKKNKKVFLQWLDSNIPADCLNDQLFQIMEKIEKGEPFGRNQASNNPVQNEIKQKQGRQTFGRNKLEDNYISNQKQKVVKMQKKITFNQQMDNQINLESPKQVSKFNQRAKAPQQQKVQKKDNTPRSYLQHQQQIKTLQRQRQNRKNKEMQAKQQTTTNLSKQKQNKQKQQQSILKLAINPLGSSNILDNSYISQIQYKQDKSIAASSSGYGYSTDRQLQSNMQILKPQQKDESHGEGEDNHMYQQYYKEYKKQKLKEFDDDMPKFGTAQRSEISNHNFYELSESKSQVQPQTKEKQDGRCKQEQPQISDMSINLQYYKQYVKKIRENYLPEEYLRQQQNQQAKNKQVKETNKNQNVNMDKNKEQNNKQNQKVTKQRQNSENVKNDIQDQVKNTKKEQLQIKLPNKMDSSQQQPQQKKEEQSQFQYKIINVKKLNFMLQNAANPYSHLRNQIILPFRKNNQQQYFLQELSLYLTTLPSIKQPQPFNSLLLCVILLFSEIQSNRKLITPLQQLYEHLASLISTNQFLKIIISLFHSVIEQTVPNLRTFLITILTKSVIRLMPFCEDPVQLLRDLSQFYNVGQNVYFEMYEQQYRQICSAIQSDVLYEVVEKALLQQGENLSVIVQSWFETKIKNKIKSCIKQVIQQNEQQGMEDEHRFVNEQY